MAKQAKPGIEIHALAALHQAADRKPKLFGLGIRHLIGLFPPARHQQWEYVLFRLTAVMHTVSPEWLVLRI